MEGEREGEREGGMEEGEGGEGRVRGGNETREGKPTFLDMPTRRSHLSALSDW